MDVSVVIVSFNVKFFLDQCLNSVYQAQRDLQIEVFVVDNDSIDGSCQMVEEKYPQVNLIANKENLGFSKANNQAIRQSKGKYVLILNPDTVIQENTLVECCNFMLRHAKSGAIGVKMIDGKGRYLPESKRSLPSPLVSFYKIFGLSALFPKSKLFAKYHLGYLSSEETHKVDVLAGAFMFINKRILDKVGYFDESFFMYGEDIDLSYRIIKAGYDNYYYPGTTIIHYKGESTKKGSINYVLVFYNAMIIFAKKHFSRKNAAIYIGLIKMAVYFRAVLAMLSRLMTWIATPMLDAAIGYAGMAGLVKLWESAHFHAEGYYPPFFFKYIIPSYILIWLVSAFYAGAYEKRVKPKDLVKGSLYGTLIILFAYSLLPEGLRFSRAIILLGAVVFLLSLSLVRLGIGSIIKGLPRLSLKSGKRRFMVIGSKNETAKVVAHLASTGANFEFIGRVSLKSKKKSESILGHISEIDRLSNFYKVTDVIFCSKNISSKLIIESMLKLKPGSVEIKIAPQESKALIGSNAVSSLGDLYFLSINSLNRSMNKRKKRLFDLVSCIALFAFSPLLVLYIHQPLGFFGNLMHVLIGKKTWVNISFDCLPKPPNLKFKPGVLAPSNDITKAALTEELEEEANLLYARDYSVYNDFRILSSGIRQLGRQ